MINRLLREDVKWQRMLYRSKTTNDNGQVMIHAVHEFETDCGIYEIRFSMPATQYFDQRGYEADHYIVPREIRNKEHRRIQMAYVVQGLTVKETIEYKLNILRDFLIVDDKNCDRYRKQLEYEVVRNKESDPYFVLDAVVRDMIAKKLGGR